MILRKILSWCFFFVIVPNISGQEKTLNFSHRLNMVDSLQCAPSTLKTYSKVFATLRGLTFVQTVRTIREISHAFEVVNNNTEIKNKEDARVAKRKALGIIFTDSPGSLLSLLWPLFLIFFVIWFLKQCKKVFISKIEF